MENYKDGVNLDNSNDSPGSSQGNTDIHHDIAAVSSSSELSLDSEVAEKNVVNFEDDLVIMKEVDVKDDLVIMQEVDNKEEEKIVIDSNEAKSFEIEEAGNRNEKVTAVSRSSELHLDSDIAEKSAEDWDLVYTKDVDVKEVKFSAGSIEAGGFEKDKEARDVATESCVDDQVETMDRDLEKEKNIRCVRNLEKDSEKEVDVFDERIKDAECGIGEPDAVENSINENYEKSREVDELSIPYFSLPKPLEYEEFKLTVEKNLEIGMKNSEHKKVTPFSSSKKIDEEDEDIIFLGFYESPSKMLPGPSRSSYTTTHSGPSSAMGPDGRMFYEISPRISSPAEAPARYSGPYHPHNSSLTPGGKREMLKNRLLKKMKVTRAQKFIRQKEMEDINNEEEQCDEEVKYKDEEEECNCEEEEPNNEEEEESKEEESCNQAKEMNLESMYTPYNHGKDIDVQIGSAYSVSTADFERRDTDSPVLFSSLPSYQPGGGFKNPDKRNDSTQEEIDIVDINSDGESCEEVVVVAISSSKSVDSFQEKQDVTIPHKSGWESPITFNEDSVAEICSGVFPSTFNSEHGPEDSASVSSWKSDPEEIKSCMWVYRDEEDISDKTSPSIKETLSSSSEPKTSAESDQLMEEETVSRQNKRCISSSEEEDGNEASSLESGEIRDDSPTSSPIPFIAKSKNRRYLSDSEDSGDEVMDEEDPQSNVEDIKMRRYSYKDFVEDEAELSGEELSPDENEDALSVVEEMEEEEVEVLESEVIEMGKIHLKKLNADDDQLLKKIKNDFLDEGELHNEDGERSRKFKWSAPSTSQAQDVAIVNSSDSEEDDNKVHVDQEKLKWLKESANGSEDLPDKQPPNEKKIKLNILSKNNINEIKAEKRSKVKRGSLLKKDGEVKNVPKDSAKKTSTTKSTFSSTQNKPPEADPL